MKVYLRGLLTRLPGVKNLEPFFRFALSQDVSNIVIGCDDLAQLEENAGFARDFRPMPPEEQEDLAESLAPVAKRLTYYKSV